MGAQKILVWDLPTRVFHWLLALSFVGAFVSADSERYRDVHVALGYTVLGLVAFRLLWGVIGTHYARFAAFAFGPREVWAYLRTLATRTPAHYLGHNPAGSWAIYLLLVLGVLSGASGYVVYQEWGGEWLAELHEAAANTMLIVVAVHVFGVLVSSLRHHENLVRAMLSGYKNGVPEAAIRRPWALVGIALFGAVATYWVKALL